MSKNITIKQDGVAQNISVDKLRTAKEEGGSVDWVPEEDIGVKALRVWRNGTYNASSFDVFGFDVVEVAVDEHGGAGAETVGDAHTGELTVHNPAIQEGELARVMGGAKRIVVDKQGGGTLTLIAGGDNETGSLYASSNRVYRARNDGKYAYTSVTVNVESGGGGGGGGGDEPYDPDNLPNALIVNPLKITYSDGDAIILQSGDAKAYVAKPNPYGGTDYTLWTHPNYPNGVIPINEVTVSPNTANYSGSIIPGEEQVYTDLDIAPIVSPFTSGYTVAKELYGQDWSEEDYLMYEADGGVMAVFKDITVNDYSIVYAGSEPFIRRKTRVIGEARAVWEEYLVTNAYTFNNKTVYYVGDYGRTKQVVPSGNDVTGVPVRKSDRIAWAMIYGTITPIPDFQTIAATWQRPYDGQTLTSDFTITVFPAGYNPLGGEVIGEGGTQA